MLMRTFSFLIRLPVGLLAILFATACCRYTASSPFDTALKSSKRPAASSEPKQFLTVAERKAFFEDLVQKIREIHVFSQQVDKNLGRTFDDELPKLRHEFIEADNREKLIAALYHLNNSLHNPHCVYNPPNRPIHLVVGFELAPEWIDGRVRFYVSRIHEKDFKDKLNLGDILVSMDGIPANDLLDAYLYESNANNWRGVARDLARFATHRYTERSLIRPGTRGTWIFRHRKSGKPFEVHAIWRKASRSNYRSGFSLDYSPLSCADLTDRAYGPYALVDRGATWCLYTSDTKPYNAFPILRQFSFNYFGPRSHYQIVVDHDHLRRIIETLPESRGIILDLRDNHGGNNPNWFLDWWAPGPWIDHFVHIRLTNKLATRKALERAHITGWGPRQIESYLNALASRKPNQRFMEPRPFFCPPSGCNGWENRYTPSHLVTRLPIALLIGPECLSSCDHFALAFSENRWGPLIGEPTSGGYTAYRMRLEVFEPRTGEYLGFLRLAFSYETSGVTGRMVEGFSAKPTHLVETTFENRNDYDRILVDTAINALTSHAPDHAK